MLTFETRLSKPQWLELTGEFCRKERNIQDLYDALFSLSPKQVKQQYAGYVLLHVHRTCPNLLSPKLPKLLTLLDKGAIIHSSIPRQLFSVLQDRALPEELAGEVFAKAVDHFLDMKQAIAVRARLWSVAKMWLLSMTDFGQRSTNWQTVFSHKTVLA